MIQLYQTSLKPRPAPAEPNQARLEARDFLRTCLGDFLKEDPKNLLLETLPSGRPILKNHPELSFSLSHSADQVAVACSKVFNVGIDIQEIRPFNEKLFERVCTPQEIQKLSVKDETEFYFLWTVKEAAMKCVGLGFQYRMNQIQIERAAQKIKLLQKKEFSMSLDYSWDHLQFADFKVPTNFVGHVAWAVNPAHPNYKANFSLRT